jgi:hypothetical protein
VEAFRLRCVFRARCLPALPKPQRFHLSAGALATSIAANRNHVVIGWDLPHTLYCVKHVRTYEEDAAWPSGQRFAVIVEFQKTSPYQHQLRMAMSVRWVWHLPRR